MIAPAQYNLRIQRRADFLLSLVFRDSEGTPMNLQGWEIVAQVWNKERILKYTDMEVEITESSQGKVDLFMPYTITSSLTSECYYDVMLISPGPRSIREYYLEGMIRPSEGYSAPN